MLLFLQVVRSLVLSDLMNRWVLKRLLKLLLVNGFLRDDRLLQVSHWRLRLLLYDLIHDFCLQLLRSHSLDFVFAKPSLDLIDNCLHLFLAHFGLELFGRRRIAFFRFGVS